MYTIQSSQLSVSIKTKGAELTSIMHTGNGLEYMWNADPKYWAKTSPVLFPIVGTLKNNTYYYKGKAYQLSRHGFARDMEFEVTDHNEDSITFSIKDNEETAKVFPFQFAFDITYKVEDEELSVTYSIQNNEVSEDMYFSVGGHPAFKLPLVEGTAYEDYSLVFNQRETAGRWPITKDGLIELHPNPLLNDTTILPLSKELFAKDAVVLKHVQSHSVRLQSDKTEHGLEFSFSGFPFLGLWAAPGADFVCIEPWCGIADRMDTDQQLEHKEGIICLPALGSFEVTWKVMFF
ncbi:aldose 1-epimerase family protein [Chitinophagaceae bacterium LB-8]|uniref:Aldose 1-epimerase family protein n=1 Tax=Paraflavisolibacter caeni TaxID=2982496 RepID=A0A9X2XVV2_9BACT|nr:aldose 1-epimerase family protein [Paraflavisolibacter caeni]MCU7550324.1 aldose 1-epimerase family protein [Paraflavisolibacter caeni]